MSNPQGNIIAEGAPSSLLDYFTSLVPAEAASASDVAAPRAVPPRDRHAPVPRAEGVIQPVPQPVSQQLLERSFALPSALEFLDLSEQGSELDENVDPATIDAAFMTSFGLTKDFILLLQKFGKKEVAIQHLTMAIQLLGRGDRTFYSQPIDWEKVSRISRNESFLRQVAGLNQANKASASFVCVAETFFDRVPETRKVEWEIVEERIGAIVGGQRIEVATLANPVPQPRAAEEFNQAWSAVNQKDLVRYLAPPADVVVAVDFLLGTSASVKVDGGKLVRRALDVPQLAGLTVHVVVPGPNGDRLMPQSGAHLARFIDKTCATIISVFDRVIISHAITHVDREALFNVYSANPKTIRFTELGLGSLFAAPERSVPIDVTQVDPRITRPEITDPSTYLQELVANVRKAAGRARTSIQLDRDLRNLVQEEKMSYQCVSPLIGTFPNKVVNMSKFMHAFSLLGNIARPTVVMYGTHDLKIFTEILKDLYGPRVSPPSPDRYFAMKAEGIVKLGTFLDSGLTVTLPPTSVLVMNECSPVARPERYDGKFDEHPSLHHGRYRQTLVAIVTKRPDNNLPGYIIFQDFVGYSDLDSLDNPAWIAPVLAKYTIIKHVVGSHMHSGEYLLVLQRKDQTKREATMQFAGSIEQVARFADYSRVASKRRNVALFTGRVAPVCSDYPKEIRRPHTISVRTMRAYLMATSLPCTLR